MEVYRLLAEKGEMTAKEIGKSLNIFPNAVYRAINQLLVFNLAEELNSYPVKFKAKKSSEALESLSTVARLNFNSVLGLVNLHSQNNKLLPLTFVQRRSDLLKMTAKDTREAKSNIKYIASGLDVPAEIILANQRAVERGVRVRIIAQNMKEITEEKLSNWKKAGVEVKYFPNMEARIFIFDRKIVYFTSYNPKSAEDAFGMRFDYAPFAVLMDELFEQRWRAGKDMSEIKC